MKELNRVVPQPQIPGVEDRVSALQFTTLAAELEALRSGAVGQRKFRFKLIEKIPGVGLQRVAYFISWNHHPVVKVDGCMVYLWARDPRLAEEIKGL